MQTSITRVSHRKWQWAVSENGTRLAGGYAATKSDAETDSGIWIELHQITRARNDGRIAKGDVVAILPEWQDDGDDQFTFIAIETQLPGMDSVRVRSIHKTTGKPGIGVQSVRLSMIAR